jgi:hypothetical protein
LFQSRAFQWLQKLQKWSPVERHERKSVLLQASSGLQKPGLPSMTAQGCQGLVLKAVLTVGCPHVDASPTHPQDEELASRLQVGRMVFQWLCQAFYFAPAHSAAPFLFLQKLQKPGALLAGDLQHSQAAAGPVACVYGLVRTHCQFPAPYPYLRLRNALYVRLRANSGHSTAVLVLLDRKRSA